MNKNNRQKGIYIHIPFCVKKCNYCDFLSASADESVQTDYINALTEEIKRRRDKYACDDQAFRIGTIYIGGGTPSCIDEALIEKVMKCLKSEFELTDDDAEITIEVNPGAVTDDKLKVYRSLGINRLSIGLQSANDNELKALGRIHNFADFERTYRAAREAGFENINVDLMTAIPVQTESSLEHTLETVTDLRPEHISAYSLIIEEGTPFFDIYGDGDKRPFDEETERAMYHMTVGFLEKHGYKRYEISNFALEGYESRHNSAYWRRRDYFGFGLGASSLIGNVRYKNTSVFQDYVNQPASRELFDERISLTRDDCMEEFMFLGLRMSEGVSEDDFEREFGISLKTRYACEIERFVNEGLIAAESRRLRLTDRGIDYGNYVFAGFLR